MRQDQLTKLRAFYISLVQTQLSKHALKSRFHHLLGFAAPPLTYFDRIVVANFEAFLKLAEV